MRKATLWLLTVTTTLMMGMSAFAFQPADKQIVLTDRRTAPGTIVDQSNTTTVNPVEAGFLQNGVNVGSRPHFSGLPQDLRAGIGLPY